MMAWSSWWTSVAKAAFVSVLCGAALFLNAASAADFVTVNKGDPGYRSFIYTNGMAESARTDRALRLEGVIEAGDEEKLSAITGWYQILLLNSDGGDLETAIKIARLVREKHLITLVERDAECLSACAVIFMFGAVEPEGGGQPEGRFLEAGGRLGFHRPTVLPISVRDQLGGIPDDHLDAVVSSLFATYFNTANQMIQDMLAIDPSAWSTDLLVEMLLAVPDDNGEPTYIEVDTVGRAHVWDIPVVGVKAPVPTSHSEYSAEIGNLCAHTAGDYQRPDIDIYGRFLEEYIVGPDRPTESPYFGKALSYVLESGNEPLFICDVTVDPNGSSYRATSGIETVNSSLQPWIGSDYDRLLRKEGGYLDLSVHTISKLYAHDKRLAEIAAPDGYRVTDEMIAARMDARRGRCRVYSSGRVVDDERCGWVASIDERDGREIDIFTWPSGSRTIYKQVDFADVYLNEVASVLVDEIDGARFCVLSGKTKNTFCHYLD